MSKHEDSEMKFNERTSERKDGTIRVQRDRYDKSSSDENTGSTDHSYYYRDYNPSTGETKTGEGFRPAESKRDR